MTGQNFIYSSCPLGELLSEIYVKSSSKLLLHIFMRAFPVNIQTTLIYNMSITFLCHIFYFLSVSFYFSYIFFIFLPIN